MWADFSIVSHRVEELNLRRTFRASSIAQMRRSRAAARCERSREDARILNSVSEAADSGDVLRYTSSPPMLLNPRLPSILAPVLMVLCVASPFVAKSQTSQNPQQTVKPASSRGKQSFAGACAGCHELDGKGSERAPNIADKASVQRLSDAQLFSIIQNGIPGTGMPAFHTLESSQIKAVVSYLRMLQGTKRTIHLPGNPDRGKTIFSGKAGCSQCHMVRGEGGFIASDLSDYAHTHDLEEMRTTILDPASSNRQVKLVTVIVRGGEKYAGRVRSEDNFSLQLQTLDGAFYFMSKSDIETLEYTSETLMPSDYGSRLNSSEVNDLISYLISVAGSSEPTASSKEKEWDW